MLYSSELKVAEISPTAPISRGATVTAEFIVTRYATYYYDEESGVQRRTLTKAYGILFKVELHGTVCVDCVYMCTSDDTHL